MNVKRKRDSNIELLRIILMLMVIAHHYVANSGVIEEILDNPLSFHAIYFNFFGAFGKLAINCFVIITGYYTCVQEYRPQKLKLLIFEVLFYKCVIYLIFLLCGRVDFQIGNMISETIDITGVGLGFTGSFILFYLLIPYLNLLINILNKSQHKRLIITLLFIFTGIDTMQMLNLLLPGTFSGVRLNYVFWFPVMYIVGAYIRKHLTPASSKQRVLDAVGIFISFISVYVGNLLTAKTGQNWLYFFVNDVSKIFAVVGAISLFRLFESIKIAYNPIINSMGGATFGILLIHACNNPMRAFLWKDVCKCVEMYDSKGAFTWSIFCVVTIYIVCWLIEVVRKRWIESFIIKKIDLKRNPTQ